MRAKPLLLSLYACSLLCGGTAGAFYPQIWDGTKVINWSTGIKSMLWLETQDGKTREFELPAGAHYVDFFEQCYFFSKLERQDGVSYLNLFRSSDLKVWEKIAFYSPSPAYPGSQIHPMGKGRFLVVNYLARFVDGKWSTCFIGKADESGRIHEDAPVDFGLQDWFFRPSPLNSKVTLLDENNVNPEYRTLPFVLAGSLPIRVGNYLVISAQREGDLWILDCTEGRIRHRVTLNPFIEEKKRFSGTYVPTCILGMQPMQDGRILIATRSKEALAADPLEPREAKNITEFQNAGFMEAVEANETLDFRLFPGIDWWALDPETGKVDPIETPMNFSTRFEKPEDFKMFRFRFKPDGNLTTKEPASTSDQQPTNTKAPSNGKTPK